MLFKGKQTQSKLTYDHMLSPVERIIGTGDLWGKVDAFIDLSEAAEYSQATLAGYRQKLGDFVRFMNSLGITKPHEVQEEHIVKYILFKKKTCNGVSVNTYYRYVKTWFNWMLDPVRKIITASPFAGMKTPSVPKTVIKPLTYEQIQRMLACCTPLLRGVRDKAIVMLIYDSGLRRTEVSNIRLSDVDLKRGAIKVMGKGAKERYVGIGDETRKAILKYLYMRKDTEPWLFVTQKGNASKMTPNGIYLEVKRLMKRAGITGVKLGTHTLRHSFATEAIRRGANLFHVQSLLGHSSLHMTRRYAQTVDSEEAISRCHDSGERWISAWQIPCRNPVIGCEVRG